jgi:hypothetical protein
MVVSHGCRVLIDILVMALCRYQELLSSRACWHNTAVAVDFAVVQPLLLPRHVRAAAYLTTCDVSRHETAIEEHAFLHLLH